MALLLILPVSSAAAQEQTTILGEPDFVETTGLSSITPNFSGCTKTLVSPVNNSYEQEIVYLTNVERQKVGATPLKRNIDLDYAARYHAKDLIDDNYFNHPTYDGWGDGINGVTYICDTGTRIGLYSSGYRGENIAGGYGSPSSAISGWMGSSGHKSNMLNTGHREIGVGYYSGGYWGSYWVQDFGTRSSVYPLVINLEAEQTATYQVNLYVYGTGTFTQMRFKNDNDAFGAWMPFASTLSWNLRQVKGTRTVTVELKKADNSITTSSDDIYLTNGAELAGLPSSIFFIYEQSSARYFPSQVPLQPQNNGGTLAMTWTAVGADTWIHVSQPGGSTPAGTTQVSINGLNTSIPGTSNSSITITVTDPSGTLNSPQIIPVKVTVVPDLGFRLFMPLVDR